MRRARAPAALVAVGLLLSGAPARGDPREAATFALVVGVNRSPAEGMAALRFADDDAARYRDLFRALGAKTRVLSRLDENTTRLHPQAAAEANPPDMAHLREAMGAIAEEVAQARSRGVASVFYFAYAGHGVARDGRALLTMEDGELSAGDLAGLARVVGADAMHLLVDACYSYLLAFGRGPGGERRAMAGFSETPELARDERVGLLLSTSSARESHEWEGLQAGIFSHEVRSGLYGAADADGDAVVSYREIAAFIERANASIPNDRFRPRIFARPPRATWRLADLAAAQLRRLEVDGAHPGHYVVESASGVRVADFHAGAGHAVRLVRPASDGRLYVRLAGVQTEYAIEPDAPPTLSLAHLEAGAPRLSERGAAHEAFGLLFELPFDRAAVENWRPLPVVVGREPLRWQSIAGWWSLGLAAAAATTAAWTRVGAQAVWDAADSDASHRLVVARNERITAYNRATVSLLSVAGVAAGLGAGLLLWPAPAPDVVVLPHGAAIAGTF